MNLLLLLVLILYSPVQGGSKECRKDLKHPEGRTTVVHLFEWKWLDIAKECENYLKNTGIGFVQISPPSEHIAITFHDDIPWWTRYQPVSYKLESRSGTRTELQQMIQRCRAVGVGIIADAVPNHMAGIDQVGHGWANSTFISKPFHESFPAVPYTAADFNDAICDHNIFNYNDPWEVRNCRLSGLADLNLTSQRVLNTIAAYLMDLLQLGVVGFRIDAAKHIYPEQIEGILNRLDEKISQSSILNKCPFIFQEVIDMGQEAIKGDDYVYLGRITNFPYGLQISEAMHRERNLKELLTIGGSCLQWADNDVLVFIDNHDNQRGSGAKVNILTYKEKDLYIAAVALMLAYPYGVTRVMSSYYFHNHDMGPPSTGAPHFYIKSPSFLSDGTCDPSSGWVCEHRWPEIRRMTLFHAIADGQLIENMITEDHRIAFSRGSLGFFALNNNPTYAWVRQLQTNMNSGIYCDMVFGEASEDGCTGDSVVIGLNGETQLFLASHKPMAISTGSALNLAPTFKRTTVFVKKHTQLGEYLFLQGGVNKRECTGQPDSCSIRIVHIGKVKENPADFKEWKTKDQYLNWFGAEPDQGKFNGQSAKGSPMLWTTNRNSEGGYSPLNNYGDHYWMFDVMMDCSTTNKGWFEVKVVTTAEEEADIIQGRCAGNGFRDQPHIESSHHIARCGSVNVFEFGKDDCTIELQ